MNNVREAFRDRVHRARLIVPLDPRIGIVCKEGVLTYYAFVSEVYREGSVEHLTHLLAQHDGGSK